MIDIQDLVGKKVTIKNFRSIYNTDNILTRDECITLTLEGGTEINLCAGSDNTSMGFLYIRLDLEPFRKELLGQITSESHKKFMEEMIERFDAQQKG